MENKKNFFAWIILIWLLTSCGKPALDITNNQSIDSWENIVYNDITKNSDNTFIEILDTPEIKAEVEKARALAGDDKSLIVTQRLQSRDLDENWVPTEAPGANTDGSESYVEPTQLFDNLYYVGGAEVGSFIFTTTEWYIMIDAGYSYSPEELIIPGMEKLGLDPAQIKYILITHAGPDHIWGARYFQENYGTQIVMSQQEWDVAARQNSKAKDSTQTTRTPNMGQASNGWGFMGSSQFPEQDIVGYDGQELTLWDTTITIIHTPRTVDGGGLSFITPVYDNWDAHMWATYWNTNVVWTLEDKKTYREAVAHFLTYVEEAKVDVIISDHPFVDGSIEVMEELRNREPGEPNPFIDGEEKVKTFFKILDQAAVILTARQEAGLNETGTAYLEN